MIRERLIATALTVLFPLLFQPVFADAAPVRELGDLLVDEPRCADFREINGILIGSLDSQEFGCELWILSGPDAPKLLLDVFPGVWGSSPRFRGSMINGWQLFRADDGTHGRELWRTDGATAEMVADINAGRADSYPRFFTQLPGIDRVYFNAWASRSDGMVESVLMSYDGTVVRNEFSHFSSRLGALKNGPIRLGNQIFFLATDDENGEEPRLFDGAQFSLVMDTAPGDAGLASENFWTLQFQDGIVWSGERTGQDQQGFGFFLSDGVSFRELPQEGLDYPGFSGTDTHFESSSVFDRRVMYLGFEPRFGSEGPTKILRLNSSNWRVYDLPNSAGPNDAVSLFLWREQAYALVKGLYYLLGFDSATVVEPPFDGLPVHPELQLASGYHTSRSRFFTVPNDKGQAVLWQANSDGAKEVQIGKGGPLINPQGFRSIKGSSTHHDLYFLAQEQAGNWGVWVFKKEFLQGKIADLSAISGSWYDPATSGQGFAVQTVGLDTSVFYFYGYRDDGEPLWLIGVSSDPILAGKPANITMSVTSGGGFGGFSPADVTVSEWGNLQINFADCKTASATLSGLDGEQTFDLVLLAGIDGLGCQVDAHANALHAGISGSWYEPDTSGQGFYMQTLGDERIIVYFYGYSAAAGQMWLIGDYKGLIGWNDTIRIDLNVTDGGTFTKFDSKAVSLSPWGTLSIRIENCSVAEASLSGINGEQTLDIEKLAQINGTMLNCE